MLDVKKIQEYLSFSQGVTYFEFVSTLYFKVLHKVFVCNVLLYRLNFNHRRTLEYITLLFFYG